MGTEKTKTLNFKLHGLYKKEITHTLITESKDVNHVYNFR